MAGESLGGTAESGGASLSSILSVATGQDRTLTVYDPGCSERALDAVRSFFEPTNVSVETASSADVPSGTAILHDESGCLSATAFESLVAVADADRLVRTDSLDLPIPELLVPAQTPLTTEWGKRRMIVASRTIEQRAWRLGAGRLDAGFQHLRRLREEAGVYRDLVRAGVDVHVYGQGGWTAPDDLDVTVHSSPAAELRRHWFVVYTPERDDQPVSTARPGVARAFLARERDANEYAGVLSESPAVAESIRQRLDARYAHG